MDLTPASLAPTVLARVAVPGGVAELVEWQWPDMIDFTRSEDALMVEMSLPPYAADASACLPDIEPDRRCFMGTLFVRWPGVSIGGRSEGGRIRVVRCAIADPAARALLARRPDPSPAFLRSLLAIRSEALRALMRLLQRELANPVDRNDAAIAALVALVTVELGRIIDRREVSAGTGRLAAWQFRRIRERVARPGPPPSVGELAALCGISVRHLHRQFAALTGKTVADYIDATRIEQAKRLLGEREQPIKAIAQSCGFAHANSFARSFRRSTGLSPLAFRQRGAGAAAPH
jgi:AraC family transcriptional regulator